jgi:hypothetical protein
MSLIIVDRNLSPPAFSAPHAQIRPGAGRWIYMEILRSRDQLRERASSGRGCEKLYAHPSRCFTLSVATQMCELLAQGRARVVVSPQDISRITVD